MKSHLLRKLFITGTACLILGGSVGLAGSGAVVLFDSGSANQAYTISSVNSTKGEGIGLNVSIPITINQMAVPLAMPNGGNVTFMIWNGNNSALLYSQTVAVPAGGSPFSNYVVSNPFSFTLNPGGNGYYFGVVGDNTISIGGHRPAGIVSENGITSVISLSYYTIVAGTPVYQNNEPDPGNVVNMGLILSGVPASTLTFPDTAVGTTSSALTLPFTFDSAGTLAATPYAVLTQGAQNLDFQAAATQPTDACVTGHTYSVDDTCEVNVTFTPTKPFQRIGAVQLMGSGGTPIATFHLVGKGIGPQVGFPDNAAVTTIGSRFSNPFGLAVDSSGNVFVADYGNNAVKEVVAVNGVVSSSSTVLTLPGSYSSPRGVAVDGSGNVFVADYKHSAVKEIVAVNGVVSPSSQVISVGSNFFEPYGVAVDSNGNVFVVQVNAVKEIVAVNGIVSSTSQVITLVSSVTNPFGVATDGNGNIFFTDYFGGNVNEIAAVNGAVSSNSQVTSVASGFNNPVGVAVDGSGNVFVTENQNSAVKEIVAVNGAVSSSSTVISIDGGLNQAFGVAVDAKGNVFVADTGNDAAKEIGRSSPPSLSFPDTNVGSQSAAQSVTLQNIGNASLTTSALTIGTNFAQVSGSGTPADCTASTSLAAGASCDLSISFQPATPGPVQSSVTLTNNNLNVTGSTQTIPLSGTGVQTVQVTVGAGNQAFTVDTTNYTSPKTFTWAVGSSHTIATMSPQTGAAGTRYVFTGWSDGGPISHPVTVSTTTTSYTASFKTQYLLTTAVNPSVGGSATGGETYYDANSNASISATPASGYVFVSWTGATFASSTSASTTVTMTAPLTVTANFNNIVNVSVGANIPGLSFSVDGATYTSTQTFQWVNGTPHTLVTTSPQTALGVQYAFSQWSDGGGLTDQVTASLSTTSYLATFQTTATPMLTSVPSGATMRNDFPGFVGMKFTTGASPINVLSLGRIYLTGSSQTHIVKLVDAFSGLDVPNASVSLSMAPGTNNTYQYAPLPTTIILPPNKSYYLLTQEFAGGDKWYDFAPVTPNAGFTVNGAEYQASVGSYILQTPGSLSYGPPNMQFVGGTILPPPVVNITSPANGAAVQGTIQLSASATPAPGLTITTVQFRLNGSNFGAPLTTAPYTLPLDTTTLLSAMNTVTAVATDSNGATTTASPVSFTIANSPSAAGPFLTGAPSGTLRSDYSGYVGLRFTVGSSALSVSQLGRWVASGNSGTHTVKLVNADGTDVPNGSVSLSLAGAPTGQYAYAPLAAPIMLAANTTYLLVTQEVAGGDRWYDVGPVTSNSAAGMVNSAVYQQSNGAYIVIGTGSNSYVPPNFLYLPSGGVASAPPTVVITAPPSGSTVSGTVQLSAAATPANGLTIQSVQFRLNGANVGPALTASPYNYSLDTTALANATYNLVAVATDSAGNTGTSATVVLTINNVSGAPAGAFLTSTPPVTAALRNDYAGYVGMKFTVSNTPLVVSQLGRWKVAGNTATHLVKLVQVDGTDVPGGSVAVNMASATAGQYAYATLASPVTLLANTSYYLVTQEFAGGDQWYDYSPVTLSSGTANAPAYQQPNGAYVTLSPGSSSYGPPNFLYSTGTTPPVQPPPTVTITSPTAGSVTGSITLAATATPASGLSIVKVQYQLNGNNVSSPLDTTTLANGQYTLTALATDSAGSVGTSAGVVITVSNPVSSTTPLLTGSPTSGLRNDFSGFVGLKFTVGSTPIKVSQLGRWIVSGNTSTHTVKLVDAVTGADIVFATVIATTAGQYNYAPASVTLAANHAYFLLTQETAGGDQWYDAGTVTANNSVTINGPAYQQSNGSYTLLFNGSGSYGTVSLLFGF